MCRPICWATRIPGRTTAPPRLSAPIRPRRCPRASATRSAPRWPAPPRRLWSRARRARTNGSTPRLPEAGAARRATFAPAVHFLAIKMFTGE
ncbi:hypothetical protein E5A74_09915 [Sphingomonas naasensis]|uniref:Uncharacterized protein n=1 Tax=Sphingomonas naasensis TaxID=1344951 RepID=A0A4S1WJT2_9SPHN|nr:hypothetical protein E5A74_09915 [Sphingomonas naasensis]